MIEAHLLIVSAGPTNCTRNFTELNSTLSTITISLTVSACGRPTPIYRVQTSSMSSGGMTVARQVNSTVYELSNLMQDTVYDVQLVDMECPNVILELLSVTTDMDPSGSCYLVVSCLCILSHVWLMMSFGYAVQ